MACEPPADQENNAGGGKPLLIQRRRDMILKKGGGRFKTTPSLKPKRGGAHNHRLKNLGGRGRHREGTHTDTRPFSGGPKKRWTRERKRVKDLSRGKGY